MGKKKQRIDYETIRGKWWLFINGKPIRELTDAEAADVILGVGDG